MPTTGRGLATAASLLVALTLGVAPAHATFIPGVRWAGGFGRTGAISAIPGDLNSGMAGTLEAPRGYEVDWEDLSEVGRWSLRLAMLAPLGERLSFGGEVFADDMAVLVAATRATGELPGTVPGDPADAREHLHRGTWGLAARADAEVWRAGTAGRDSAGGRPGWIPRSTLVASGTAGWWRVNDDRLRRSVRSEDAFGWSLGLGWRFQLPGRVALGPAVRYCRVFDDGVGRYVTASMDWGWR